MLTLDISNLHKIDPSHGLTEKEVSDENSKIQEFLEKIEARDQGFHRILDQSLDEINNFAKTADFENIIVCGIGGSSLGAICLKQALTHLFKTPKLYVLDNIDPSLISEVEDIINYEKTLFIIITKSGGTAETLSQYHYFRSKVKEKNLDPKDHFAFITDPEKGSLREISSAEEIPTFNVPPNVGGRFSVLTPVGLLPSKLIDINIDKLLAGAKTQRDKFLSKQDNPAFTLATIQYLLSQKGKNINVMMPYAQRLTRLADWYRQLLAESIGKNLETGLTPVNALGVTDQHSQLQLYNAGPNDKLIIFIEVEDLGKKVQIPKHFDGKLSFNQLIDIEKRATEDSLTKSDRPNITIKLDSISEESLGELFMLLEGSIAFLGEFYGINAFDQPGVELSKKLTKQYVEDLT